MMVFHGIQQVLENADYSEFNRRLGEAMMDASDLPFFLVRDDGTRLLVAVHPGLVLLAVASNTREYGVSYGATYAEGTYRFRGIHEPREAGCENFLDPPIAIDGIKAFFQKSKLSDTIEIRNGLPDPAILEFPAPIAPYCRIEREQVEKTVILPARRRLNLREVCVLLDTPGQAPEDSPIDFDDAIQIGSLNGGRTDRRHNLFSFSYHDESGEVWNFSVNRIQMDRIVDGTTDELAVSAFLPIEDN